jgi:3-hydroxyacyl-CoA dehydrogenase
MTDFKKVAVIGAGVMGSGIAAQITNAGIPVVLLDIVPDGADNRNVIAQGAVAKMLKAEPAPFMLKRNAKLIECGNLEDDLDKLGECDWIVEVVLEDLNIKHATYEKIAKHRKKGSIVSSNTSTIPLAKLMEGMDKDMAKSFMISHFFNPPRYMRLLEIIQGDATNQDAVDKVAEFCDVHMGKTVVHCNDTPGFIVNRILTFWMQKAINTVLDNNVPIEVADAVMSKPIGVPKTGVFGLVDLVGVDLMPYLSKSLLSNLPDNDEYRKIARDIPFVDEMIAAGYNGRKGSGGFYRLNPDAPKGTREKQTVNFLTQGFDENTSYRKSDKPSLASVSAGKKGMRAVLETDDIGGVYAKEVMVHTLAYAASLVPQIADGVYDVDRAMQMGCNWKFGPFEMIDQLGAAWLVSEIEAAGHEVPDLLKSVGDGSFYKIQDGQKYVFGTDGKYHAIERGEGVLILEDIKLKSKPLYKTASASLWDVDDGVICLEFTGKMNALDEQVFETIAKAIKLIGDGQGDYKALVVYNEGTHFSAGANLGLAIFMMNIALFPQIEEFVAGGQRAYMALKHAPFPVVSAPSGFAFGGGCEILLHSDHVQLHAETYTGLVEVGVGIVPGWGGCKELILRYQEREAQQFKKSMTAIDSDGLWFSPDKTPMGAVRKAFEVIATATVAKSGAEAKEIYFRDSDGVTMNRDRLLFDAKEKALDLVEGYEAPSKRDDIRLPGPTGKAALDLAVGDLRRSGKATPYDVTVSSALATVLTGGDKADWTEPMNDDDLLKLERDEFMKLVQNEGTMARIEHMLAKGKPLRN